MLQVHEIRDNKEEFITALAKRGLEAQAVLEEVLAADEARRNTQAKLDETLAQANTLSKEIGMLFKSGATDKANELKEKSSDLKERSKQLQDQLNAAVTRLEELLYTLPNIPHSSVPAGTDETDNEEVFREGTIPELQKDALPHWELAKK